MNEQQALTALQTGNMIAFEWYLATHPASTQLLGNVTVGQPGSGVVVSTGSNSTLLILGLIAVAAFVLLGE